MKTLLVSPKRSTPPSELGRRLSVCHHCPRRQRGCSGACACLEDGRDIIVHARGGDCPLGRYQVGEGRRGLGDLVARWAKWVGAEWAASVFTRATGKSCGCGRRREKLNRLFPYFTGNSPNIVKNLTLVAATGKILRAFSKKI